jgi:hypothetical protein
MRPGSSWYSTSPRYLEISCDSVETTTRISQRASAVSQGQAADRGIGKTDNAAQCPAYLLAELAEVLRVAAHPLLVLELLLLHRLYTHDSDQRNTHGESWSLLHRTTTAAQMRSA